MTRSARNSNDADELHDAGRASMVVAAVFRA